MILLIGNRALPGSGKSITLTPANGRRSCWSSWRSWSGSNGRSAGPIPTPAAAGNIPLFWLVAQLTLVCAGSGAFALRQPRGAN